jgi:hypothetical protein
MSAAADLARELTELVLATAGVQEVYPAGAGLEPLVRVSRSGGTGRVLATICVLDDHPVPATLRQVSRALAERLGAEPEEFDVTVKASRIQ